ASGRQVYIVYPLIEESEKLDYLNLMQGFEAVQRDFPIPEYQVSVVHGQMKPEDKEFEMQRFKDGKTHIMVATTVIEVGVDIPNATVMLIESAERFGLSQLHQLRGRVGRGSESSYCILITKNEISKEAIERMSTMVRTNDGFEVAEVDLRLRGPGDIEGTRQSGELDLKISDLIKDTQILELARNLALQIIKDDPQLVLTKNLIINEQLRRMKKGNVNWSVIS
ncbi:MAG: ATP-dependent DNA helicase RecG, partial [Bacteroidia bacterium]|nr:ATP-dependent DNA helicase RecG [Bacteroidia bacterium]